MDNLAAVALHIAAVTLNSLLAEIVLEVEDLHWFSPVTDFVGGAALANEVADLVRQAADVEDVRLDDRWSSIAINFGVGSFQDLGAVTSEIAEAIEQRHPVLGDWCKHQARRRYGIAAQ